MHFPDLLSDVSDLFRIVLMLFLSKLSLQFIMHGVNLRTSNVRDVCFYSKQATTPK